MALVTKGQSHSSSVGAEEMRRVFERYDVPYPLEDRWVAIHCIGPDHNDSEESASVHGARGAYRCHACGLAGNAVTLLARMEGIEYGDAEVIVSGDAGESGPEGVSQWI